MPHKERLHNSHLEVINNSPKKKLLIIPVPKKTWTEKINSICKVLSRQVHQGIQLYAIPITYFCAGGSIYRCWNILLRLENFAQSQHHFQCSESMNLDHIEGHCFNFKVYAFGICCTQTYGVRSIFCVFTAVLCHFWCVLFHQTKEDWQFSPPTARAVGIDSPASCISAINQCPSSSKIIKSSYHG